VKFSPKFQPTVNETAISVLFCVWNEKKNGISGTHGTIYFVFTIDIGFDD
jgi:hypothetical protein